MEQASATTAAPGPARKSGRDVPVVQIVSRTAAALLGGYALTYWFAAALARLLPLARSELIYLTGMLQILAFVGVVIWIFAVASMVRMWSVLVGLTALCAALALVGRPPPAPPAEARLGSGMPGAARAAMGPRARAGMMTAREAGPEQQ